MAILPNIMWYHHYVFVLLPILIWMGWKYPDFKITAWCLLGLTIIQVERYLTFGFLAHVFVHISMLLILLGQIRQFYSQRDTQSELLT